MCIRDSLDTLSIEVCHPDATGQFTQASYDALVKLTAWLCDYCGIGRDHVIRHYDVTGKLCPLYFVDHPDAWTDVYKRQHSGRRSPQRHCPLLRHPGE